MFLLLPVTTFFILEKKFSKMLAAASSAILLGVCLVLNQLTKPVTFNYFILFSLSLLMAYSFSSTYTYKIKRNFYSFQMTLLPTLALVLCMVFMKTSVLLSKYNFAGILSGIVLGSLLDSLQGLPFGFQSRKEYSFFKKYLQSKKMDLAALTKAFKLNYTNFITTKEIVSLIEQQSEFFKSESLDKALLNSLFYWTQQPHFNSMNPLAARFNQLSFETFKRELVAFDLADKDIELLFNLIRCGCWKPGLFLLDQYLVSNKFSAKYPSTLIFVDKFLNDLKKVSFDDETIEIWLKTYGEVFKGTPVSQKISLIYHNKDDWFQKDIRYAAL